MALSNYERVRNFRTRLKERSVYVLGDVCQCCGYDKCITALEFHHLDPSQKDFNFSENTNRSWAFNREELKKCILVCANCHREIHAGLIDNNTLHSSFNEERAKEIDALVRKLSSQELHYCKNCGAEVDRRSEYCPKCAMELRRVVERPSRDELKNLIRTIPFTTIAQNYGVTDNAIRKWCDLEHLPRKKSIIKSISDEDWELI